MKYKPSALVETMSGSQGDSTFSTGRAGDYIRRRVNPAQPRTARQMQVRSAFSGMSAVWRTLTEAQRNGWKSLASTVTLTGRYGNTYRPTGQQLFVSVNLNEGRNPDEATPDAPGVSTPAAPLNSLVINVRRGAAAANDIFTVTGSNGDVDTSMGINATGSYSAGRSYISPSQLRFVINKSNAQLGAGADIKAAYEAIFGRPALGAKVSVEVVPINVNGFAGPARRATVVVIAV
jgi:hypothetical protein